jgi:hypothetical protein
MVDTTIALQARAPNLLGALQQGIQAGGMFRQLQAQRLAQAQAAQDFRITQAANAFQKIQPAINKGNFSGAVSSLKEERQTLLDAGVKQTPDIDLAIQALESGDANAILGVKQQGEQILTFAQQRGLLSTQGVGLSADQRGFEFLIKDFSKDEQVQARKVRAGLLAKAGSSAQERIASNEALKAQVAALEEKLAESKAVGKGKGEFQVAPLISKAKADIATAVKLAEAEASSQGVALSDLKKAEAGLPGVEEVVAKLRGLSSTATFTTTGRVFNTVAKELGFGATKGATARAAYQGTIDNQVLPLLKQTFGAAMTEGEGKRLADTLGDVNAAPEEKQAQLDAFIDSQRRQIESLKRETGSSIDQNSFTSSSGITFTVE